MLKSNPTSPAKCPSSLDMLHYNYTGLLNTCSMTVLFFSVNCVEPEAGHIYKITQATYLNMQGLLAFPGIEVNGGSCIGTTNI